MIKLQTLPLICTFLIISIPILCFLNPSIYDYILIKRLNYKNTLSIILKLFFSIFIDKIDFFFFIRIYYLYSFFEYYYSNNYDDKNDSRNNFKKSVILVYFFILMIIPHFLSFILFNSISFSNAILPALSSFYLKNNFNLFLSIFIQTIISRNVNPIIGYFYGLLFSYLELKGDYSYFKNKYSYLKNKYFIYLRRFKGKKTGFKARVKKVVLNKNTDIPNKDFINNDISNKDFINKESNVRKREL